MMSGKTLHRFGVVLSLGLFVLLGACAGDDASVSGGGVSSTPPVAPARASLSFDRTRIFRFTWTDASDATYYRLLEDSDGLSGYTQIGDIITKGTQAVDYTLSVPLYKKLNARYILQSCNAKGCNDDNPVFVSGTLAGAIGYFKASNPDAADRFGASVGFSGDGNTLAVGASGEDSSTTGINSTPNDDGSAISSGAVYVYTLSDSIWTQQAYIKRHNIEAASRFGESVSLSDDGNTLVVGASGAASIFTRSENTWTQQAYLKGSNTSVGDGFGMIVSISGDGNTLVAGAKEEDGSGTCINPPLDDAARNSGAVYVFVRSGTTWSQQAYIKAQNTERSDRFGGSLSLSGDGDTLAVGAELEDNSNTGTSRSISFNDEAAQDSGAVYVYTRSGSTWSCGHYIKASNTEAFDAFGWSVSLNGDGTTLAVGAFHEDSNSTGINSIPNDDGTVDDAGAVYVFGIDGSNWFQNAYIKAFNTGWIDEFGWSVSLSDDGNTLAVGALGEDGNSTGINPSNNDDSMSLFTGAAYLFTRSGSTWSHLAYIKSINIVSGNWFGSSVSLSDDGGLVVGSMGEGSSSAGINSTPNDDGTADQSGSVYMY